MTEADPADVLFAIGDYAGGAACGGLTAAAVRALVEPRMDMVLAMLAGMGLGLLVHLGVTLLLTPVIGAFHAMVPGSLIGMYGGMLFAMRDTMQHPASLAHAVWIGGIFGIVMVTVVRLYDRALRDEPSPAK